MAIELNLTKPDNKTPWGFRLTGGSDYNSPLVVVKVAEESRAQDCGLGVNDIVIRINDILTDELTHSESQDLINASGNDLLLSVHRHGRRYLSQGYTGDNSTEEEINDEVLRILEGAREALEKEGKQFEPIISYEYIIDRVPSEKEMTVHTRQEISQQNISEHVASVSSAVSSTQQMQPTSDTRGRKWSTFLQKPKNPIPKSKPREEPRKIEGEPYRVVIKKQKKRTYTDPYHLDEILGEDTKDTEPEATASTPEPSQTEQINEIYSENQSGTEYKEEPETNEEEKNDYENQDGEDVENFDGNINIIAATPEKEPTPEPVRELTLEERLAEVQKQLEALSQLPTDIQETLSDVTKKLAEIVGLNTEPNKEDGERHVSFKLDDEISLDSEAELRSPASSEGVEEDSLEADARERENNVFDTVNAEEGDLLDGLASLTDELAQPEEVNEETIRLEEEARRQEEELRRQEEEAQRLEEERLEKLEKEEEERNRGPIQRPIILPGGRRWCDPDDACAKMRKPKLSDEKIADTLDHYSEVITGKLKGINFLKYQPPAKNMDFLQKSEVYRLVHDMEPPVKGISTRAGKILAEEDYYEKASPSPAS